jgi:hypothetical protein
MIQFKNNNVADRSGRQQNQPKKAALSWTGRAENRNETD